MTNKAVVLDANILIRAVLGNRVRRIIEDHAGHISFFVPQLAYAEAEKHLGTLVKNRGGNPAAATGLLSKLVALCEVVTPDLYTQFETKARHRLGSRDPEDWPILACAIALSCPIWTEDTDFFGCGVATWTSRNIHLFLAD
jgi:predicted nucleic acid-binding protein